MTNDSSAPLSIRKRPAREGATTPKYTQYIFVTCCTRNRRRALDNETTHELLLGLWRDKTQWVVLSYVITPDHIHLIVVPSQSCSVSLRNWAAWWKAQVTKELSWPAASLWLPDLWDTRMRSNAHYAAKRAYMRENPVRAGLVSHALLWPYHGDIADDKPC